MPKYFDAIIIGGGLNGLSAAWHLSQMSVKSIAVLEQFEIGHQRGSSHGMSRIIRSTYPDKDLINLMQVVLQQEWPVLEKACGMQLIHQQTGCLFGPEGGLFDSYARAVSEAGADVDLLDEKQAALRFPMFNFKGLNALSDNSAGLIDAMQTIQGLKKLAIKNNVQIIENSPVIGIDIITDPVMIETGSEIYRAESLIVANGAWAGRLIPQLSGYLKVVRQTVGYFSTIHSSAFALNQLPVWVYLGSDEDDMFYGLPEFGRPGIKAARHLTTASADNPDTQVEPNVKDLDPVKTLLEQRLKFPVPAISGSETCLYTMTPNHNFIIDNHPDNSNVVIAAGFSGHGFKFGPLTGRLLAELVMKQTTSLQMFNGMREKFALPANRD